MACHLKTRAIFVALIAVPCASAQFASQNVTLRSQVTPAQVGATRGSSNWGYVSPSGREYALVGYDTNMTVVEVTNPAAPVIVESISHATSIWCEVKVYQHYAYVTNESSGGLDIVDLSQVDNGIVTLVQRYTGGGLFRAHTVTLDEVSGFLYLNGSNLNGGRIVAYSLANPVAPVFVGQVSSAIGGYCHDSQVVTYTSGPYAGQQIAFSCEPDRGVAIYDVTNKAAITRLSLTNYPNRTYTHQGWLSEDRHYFYVNDEIDGLPQTRVFDVTNLSAVTMPSTFFIGEPTVDHNIFIHNGFIFESNYTCGLQIFDGLANPLNPPRVGYIDTHPENNGQTYDGAWNNYPFFPSGTVAISDIQRGLFVVDVSQALNYLTFTFPNGRPATISPAGGTTMRVEVAGRLAAPAPGTGVLHVDSGAGFVDVPMTPVSPNVYEAVFPAVPCGAVVSYYVSADNMLGVAYSSPRDAPTLSYSTVSASSSNIVLNETFEAAGWTAGAAGDNASGGVWTRVNPIGTDAQPEDDHSDPGTFCWVTGQGTVGGAVGDADVDAGRTTLLSPTFDFSSYAHAVVGYWRWYSNNQGGAPNADTFRVDITNNNGANWVNVETVGPAGPEAGGGWYYHEFATTDFVTLTAQMRLRFIAEDLGGASIIEAALDDFQVREVGCDETPCPPDLNNDGVVDLADLSLLLSDFGCTGGSCAADLDDSGATDLSDLALLLSAFGTACP